ncbi:MAG TPA: MauE/DoxX family redox-associated membrane protein, partial [Vicinamibacteria bacterium]|nr:MauE/DoxX family redox-associated membrane protein [Vicinamibacteria bacterium]
MTARRASVLRHPALYWAVAIGLGALFVYASLDKIAAPRDFARIIYHYRLIGPSASLGFVPANLLAVVLPWVELLCGLLLITGLWRREAAVLTAAMLVMFVG